ncbi:MAG: efflux RND transporter periplasmic adaptor subunit [Methylophilaceae bacterium]|nr:efflux RND transporter periplasmic adaptor subunit [Methylophilaceae bacterium]
MFQIDKVFALRIFMCLLLVELLSACDHPAPVAVQPRPALSMVVGSSSSAAVQGLVGEVRPRYETAQGFRIAGKIIERRVEVGQIVTKGQVLARLDALDSNLSAQAASAQVHTAEANFALARAEFERQKLLYTKKFISASALDQHEAQFKSAAAQLEQTRAQAAVAGNQSRYTTLEAERDGVVTEIRAEPGQVVVAGEAIARVAVQNVMEVVIAVPESRMAGVAVGVPAQIKLWVDGNKAYNGRIREVAPAADPATRTFQVRVSILDADAAVRLGMTAGVRLAAAADRFFRVPSSALTKLNGQAVVWVLESKAGEMKSTVEEQAQVQPRAVKTGAYTEDGVLIQSGLKAGERIVVAGVHTLVPGQIVRPLAAGIDHESN